MAKQFRDEREDMKGKKTRLRTKLLLALLSPVVFLGVVEGMLRMAGTGHPVTFLLKKEFGGKEYYVANPHFTTPWFPEQNPRTPVPFGIPLKKPAGSLRILVLGASAAQGDPKPEFGFSRMMERMLSGQFENRPVEVYNFGITAINSHVTKEIAKECRQLEADYWLVYLGNNEVIGPFGPANPALGSGALVGKLRMALLKTRTGQMMASMLRGRDKQLHWKGMESYLVPVEWGSKELEEVYAQFTRNLSGIAQYGAEAGAKVILCTVASNLRGCSPLKPEGQALQSWKDGKWKDARDQDTFRFRADSRTNGCIESVASAQNARLLKIAEEFETREADSPTPLFLDHVHFTLEGNNLVAALAGQLVMDLEGIEPHPPKKNPTLGYTEFEKQGILRIMQGRLSRPPFLGQQPGGLSPALLDGQIKGLAIQSPSQIQSIQAKYGEATAIHPEDAILRNVYSTFLLSFGMAAEASKQGLEAAKLAPWDANAHYNLALAHSGNQSPVSARKCLDTALALAPNHSRAHALMATLLAKSEPKVAFQHFDASVRIEPDDPLTLVEFVKFLLDKGDKASVKELEKAYALALRANRLSGFEKEGLVGLLERAAKRCGREDEARKEILALKAARTPGTAE